MVAAALKTKGRKGDDANGAVALPTAPKQEPPAEAAQPTEQQLTDEEMAWRLHQELNSFVPVLRTRSRKTGADSKSADKLARRRSGSVEAEQGPAAAAGSSGGEQPAAQEQQQQQQKGEDTTKQPKAQEAAEPVSPSAAVQKRAVKKHAAGKTAKAPQAAAAEQAAEPAQASAEGRLAAAEGASAGGAALLPKDEDAAAAAVAEAAVAAVIKAEQQEEAALAPAEGAPNQADTAAAPAAAAPPPAAKPARDKPAKAPAKAQQPAAQLTSVKPTGKVAGKPAGKAAGKAAQQEAGGSAGGKAAGRATQQEAGSKVASKPLDAKAAAKLLKIPRLPMVRHSNKWYRCRVLKEDGERVLMGEPLPCVAQPERRLGCLLLAGLVSPLSCLWTALHGLFSSWARVSLHSQAAASRALRPAELLLMECLPRLFRMPSCCNFAAVPVSALALPFSQRGPPYAQGLDAVPPLQSSLAWRRPSPTPGSRATLTASGEAPTRAR